MVGGPLIFYHLSFVTAIAVYVGMYVYMYVFCLIFTPKSSIKALFLHLPIYVDLTFESLISFSDSLFTDFARALLLAYIDSTRGFHCDISIAMYSVHEFYAFFLQHQGLNSEPHTC
jgi:hypothetical protein